ncbi:hypothetical protein B0I31_113172 [Saccharothrix carnea]|uniref:Uncharacterized protein n=1 Tax=Saccharothrix carnea TaxID=1280637 RepID=A0A2P8I207_SACCR|nr:hypothetical protein B0I31_113172 [Saccharothrix carnea]
MDTESARSPSLNLLDCLTDDGLEYDSEPVSLTIVL